jgi:hypothetical protein
LAWSKRRPIAGWDFNVEGATEKFHIPIENDKQDEDVVPVVPPLRDIVLETLVPIVNQLNFSFPKQ